MTFGYPVHDAQGQLKAILFTSIQIGWFDKLVSQFKLPAGWNAFLLSDAGEVLSYHTDNGQTPMQRLAPEVTQRFLAALQSGQTVSELEDLDGHQRMYGIVSLRLSRSPLVVAVGAPVDRTVAGIDQGFWLRIALLFGIALLSALAARYYVYGLIEAWTHKITGAIDGVAAGRLERPIPRYSRVRELQAVEQGINHLADELLKRDVDLRRLSTAVEQSPESIVITDTQACIQYVNEAFVRNTGYTREEVLGHNPRILNHGKTDPSIYKAMWDALVSRKVWRGEFTNTRKDGSTYVEMAIISPIVDANGQVTHFVATKEDITQQKQSEELVHRLAYFDALTGLPNRALLQDRLLLALQASAQHSMLLLVDIDRFNQINDTWGHAAGDLLLCEMARRIRDCMGAQHTVARLGSNTFGAIVQTIGATAEQAMAAAHPLALQLHNTLAAPYELGASRKLYIATSAGVTLFGAATAHPDVVLQQAEMAMYRAKEEGGSSVLFFDDTMQATMDARVAMEMGLRDAIANHAFELYYQVQVDQAGTVVGAEALIRWIGADGKVISPADFIPLAEETGLIVPMGQWVLDTACQQLARWQRNPATRHLTLAVNVSARQFHQADFVALVHEAIDSTGIHPGELKLELTESAILGDIEATITKMHQLRDLGLRFALDDFGTGYSSLSYLKRLPFDQLKIDQSFTQDMLNNSASSAIVRAVLVISEALGLEVVAEGVETAAQRAFLISHGCQFCQGYLLGRPVPIGAWEAAHTTRPDGSTL